MPYRCLQEYRQHASFVNLEGFRLAYWEHNNIDKPVILLIHGFPSASWDWQHQWQELQSDYHLVAMDMLGFGLSDKPAPFAYSLVQQAGFYLALLKHLNINRCHILAHDYGDSVAQELLSQVHMKQARLQLDSVTFLNGGLFSESHRPLLTQKLLKSPLGPFLVKFLNKASLEKSFKRIFGPQTPPSTHDIDCLWQLLVEHNGIKAMPYLLQYIAERKRRRADWLAAMQTTNVPLYFINGSFDPISGEHMRQRYEQLIPNPLTRSLAVGHYPQIEAPDQVSGFYLDFLSSINT